jgi:hypothetical protein
MLGIFTISFYCMKTTFKALFLHSHGNALGIGLADLTSQRLYKKSI